MLVIKKLVNHLHFLLSLRVSYHLLMINTCPFVTDKLKCTVFRSNRKQAYPFLIPFGIELFLGATSSIRIIDYLLTVYRTSTLMFFYGNNC